MAKIERFGVQLIVQGENEAIASLRRFQTSVFSTSRAIDQMTAALRRNVAGISSFAQVAGALGNRVDRNVQRFNTASNAISKQTDALRKLAQQATQTSGVLGQMNQFKGGASGLGRQGGRGGGRTGLTMGQTLVGSDAITQIPAVMERFNQRINSSLDRFGVASETRALISSNLQDNEQKYGNDAMKEILNARRRGFAFEDAAAAGVQLSSTSAIKADEIAPMIKMASDLAMANKGTVQESTKLLLDFKSIYNLSGQKLAEFAERATQGQKLGDMSVSESSQYVAPAAMTLKRLGFNENETFLTSSLASNLGPNSETTNNLTNMGNKLFKPNAETEKFAKRFGITVGAEASRQIAKDGSVIPYFEELSKKRTEIDAKYGQNFFNENFMNDSQASSGVDAMLQILPLLKVALNTSAAGMTERSRAINESSYGVQSRAVEGRAEAVSLAFGEAMSDSSSVVNKFKISVLELTESFITSNKEMVSIAGTASSVAASGLEIGSKIAMLLVGLKSIGLIGGGVAAGGTAVGAAGGAGGIMSMLGGLGLGAGGLGLVGSQLFGVGKDVLDNKIGARNQALEFGQAGASAGIAGLAGVSMKRLMLAMFTGEGSAEAAGAKARKEDPTASPVQVTVPGMNVKIDMTDPKLISKLLAELFEDEIGKALKKAGAK